MDFFFKEKKNVFLESENSQSSLFLNFFKKIFNNLNVNYLRSNDPTLKSKVQKNLPKLNSILQELVKISLTNDTSLSPLVMFVVAPLINQAEALKVQSLSADTLLKPQVISEQIRWTERALSWINLIKSKDGAQLFQSISQHIYEETFAMITKDLLLISEYEEHQLSKLELEEKEFSRVKDKIGELLRPTMDHLVSLRQKTPKCTTLDEVITWRNTINAARQKNFNQSLAVIDHSIDLEFPLRKIDDVQGHLIEIIDEIVILENKFQNLKTTIASNEGVKLKKRRFLGKISSLHEQATSLSLDIRLTQELFDRLQDIITGLQKISLLFK